MSAGQRVALIALMAFAAHCSRAASGGRDDDLRFGESIAVRVEGPHLSSYDLLVAMNEGVDTNALVSPLTSLVHAALLACPEAQGDSGPASITLSFTTSEGHLQRDERSGQAPHTSAEQCLLQHMDGHSLGAAGPSVKKMVLQLKAVGPDAAPLREGDHATPP